jgi:predicted alpha/beta hydrolase family esterase/GNAT superfamily N-acetyltransferase
MHHLVVPGIGDSGVDHWQSLWQSDWGAAASRVTVGSWWSPDLDDWCRAIEEAASARGPTVVIAHSLGCLAVTHVLATRALSQVVGLLLVAPPDPDGPAFPSAAASFRESRPVGVGVPGLVVCSDDDPFCDVASAARLTTAWGASRITLHGLGHINANSGLGGWDAGRALLGAFEAQVDGTQDPSQLSLAVLPVSTFDDQAAELMVALTEELAEGGYPPSQTFGYSLQQLRASDVELRGVFAADRLVGAGGVELQAGGFAELKRFYVRPSWRGSPAASQLLSALIEVARSHGRDSVRLETGDRQHAALAFYRKHGFVDVPRFGRYAASSTSVCLQLDLRSTATRRRRA